MVVNICKERRRHLPLLLPWGSVLHISMASTAINQFQFIFLVSRFLVSGKLLYHLEDRKEDEINGRGKYIIVNLYFKVFNIYIIEKGYVVISFYYIVKRLMIYHWLQKHFYCCKTIRLNKSISCSQLKSF